MALRDLREKVANGGDLTKLHEMPVDQEGNHEQGMNHDACLHLSLMINKQDSSFLLVQSDSESIILYYVLAPTVIQLFSITFLL